jgi:hypothetical protein
MIGIKTERLKYTVERSLSQFYSGLFESSHLAHSQLGYINSKYSSCSLCLAVKV